MDTKLEPPVAPQPEVGTQQEATPRQKEGRSLQPHPASYLLKRLILGRALPTKDLIHQRLGKPTALAVFASDNLSSVAYATEEILRNSVLIVGAAAFSILMPATIAILAILGILIFSYRQTIKAYPSAGGAYIVTKDNFGILPAQVAGVALLTDYVLTVSVSVAAGVAAVYTAFGFLYPWRVPLCVLLIWFIAWGNLRGVRESGRMFVVPTYFFIVMMILLIGEGLFQAFAGHLHPMAIPPDVSKKVGAISIFLLLKAFASGGAAVTGVEAISNGIPAFKPPAWRNAQTTLVWMGSLLGAMFLGLSFLAFKLHTVPTPKTAVIVDVAGAVFGKGVLFYMLAVSTAMILILAANTSFADFPRLANFHAGDDFMPRQLTKRGHRLTFSNGIIGLAIAASTLVILFAANVNRLIPLYAIGVFTSFTLSQAGMAKRHLRLREPGWKTGLVINGIGAVTTGVVDVIIAVMKFWHGAWAVMVFVPVLVWVLVRMNRRYAQERQEMNSGLEALDRTEMLRPLALIVVQELDHKTLHALQYVKTISSQEAQAVHFERENAGSSDLRERWAEMGLGIPLKIVKATSDIPSCLAGYVGALPDDLDVNVIIPGPARMSTLERVRDGRTGTQLAKALLPYQRARITLVRDHSHEYDGAKNDATNLPGRHRPRLSHKVVVLVDKVDRASMKAVRYAVSLGATEVWGVHAAVDLENQTEVMARWLDLFSPVPLQVIECWDRNIARSIECYVAEIAGPDDEITVVIPRRDYAQKRQRLLHDRTSRSIARALGRYAHVDVTVVPYYFQRASEPVAVG